MHIASFKLSKTIGHINKIKWVQEMLKRYQIELDRNERDFATFLRSRKVTLSKNEFKVLLATQAFEDQVSLFKKYDHKKYSKGLTLSENR